MNTINLSEYADAARSQDIIEYECTFCPACGTKYYYRGGTYETRPMIGCVICKGDGATADAFYLAVGEELKAITSEYLKHENDPGALAAFVAAMKQHARTWKTERFEVMVRLRHLEAKDPSIEIDIDID